MLAKWIWKLTKQNKAKKMKILISSEEATQAKLILKPGFAVIKVPKSLEEDVQKEVTDKLMKIANLQKDNKLFLKAYYRIGAPYVFLNKKVGAKRKKTFVTYTYKDL